MEKRRLGRTDMDVTVLGFGGAGPSGEDVEKIGKVLNSALDAGIERDRHSGVLSTAARNRSVNAISKRRTEFFLFTKCGHPRGIGTRSHWSGKSISESIERSLRRLQTDRIDLIHLHGCSESVLKKAKRFPHWKKRVTRLDALPGL